MCAPPSLAATAAASVDLPDPEPPTIATRCTAVTVASRRVSEPGQRALILLNGPPASGKSSLARRYAEARSDVAVVDIDVIRGSLELWPERPLEAGLRARRIAIDQIAQLLGSGHDVIVPQLLGRPDFAEQLQAVAHGSHARFTYVALRIDRSEALDAFIARRDDPENSEHVDAEVLVPRDDDARVLGEMYDAFVQLSEGRGDAKWVDVTRGDIEATLRRLVTVLA